MQPVASLALERWNRRFMACNRWFLIVTLGLMCLLIFANVALRYLTSQSIDWAEEVARYLMIWLTFMGIGPVLRYGGHIAVDNLQDALPEGLARAVRGLIALALIGFFTFFMVFGVDYMERTQHQLTATTQIPFSWVYAALPLGCLNALLHWLYVLRKYVLHRAFDHHADFDMQTSTAS